MRRGGDPMRRRGSDSHIARSHAYYEGERGVIPTMGTRSLGRVPAGMEAQDSAREESRSESVPAPHHGDDESNEGFSWSKKQVKVRGRVNLGAYIDSVPLNLLP